VVCRACQTENKEGAKFCNECGEPLGVRCRACGAPHRAGQKFCDECGTALAGAPAGAPVPVSPAVAVEAARRPTELRLVSVLFVDLVGFTSLSESREAEDVRELLGRYFDSARTIVDRYGGVIEKFIGDAVMAVWGVPVAREDDAERAVRAALELVDAVAVLGADVGAPDLRARAGVVTGQVAASEDPGQVLIAGDRVNTAARVQSAAPPGSVLVDEVTRFLTAVAVVFEDAGEHAVKGKAEPLKLWRAVRVVAGVGGSQREQGLDAPFVGRTGDLRLVKALFHGALERRSARLVAVSGEAGVGKSRLRRECFNYVDGLAEPVLWHSGRCLSFGDGVAYWALAEMVRQRLGIVEEASTEEAAARLAAGLERWVPNAADRTFLRPRLGALLGVAEPGLGREELFAGWRLFFEQLAMYQPVLLVFEDMQWADPGLLAFIEQLLEWSAASPIFMVTLARPELAASCEGWPAGRRGATTLELEPLDDDAMCALLDGLVDGLPEQAAQRIVEQAQGVPLYAIETIRALADRGVLTEREGRLFLEGELGELEVPASLSSLLAARLDALEPAARGLVKAMSVFGAAFPRSAAAALADVPDDQLDAVLDGLVRRQVLVIRADPLSPDTGQYAFAQGLLRTVAYEMLSRRERKPRHRAAAEHLRSVFANDGEEVAEVIASHYLDAYHAAQGDPDADELRVQTLAALRRAAQRAATVGAPEAAERAYRTAIQLAADEVQRTELTQAAGEMALQSGRLEPALELLEAASDAYAKAGRERDSARIAGRIGLALVRLGHNEEAAERIAAALQILAGDEVDAEVGALNRALGGALVFAGDYERAGPPLETALRIAQALKLPDLLSDALTNKANMYLQTGRAEEARCLFSGAIDVAQRHGLAEALVRAHSNSGNLAMQWDLPDAEHHSASSLGLARRRGDRYMESVSAGNLMTVHLFAGRWREAELLAAELLDGSETRAGAAYAHYPMVILHVLRGEIEGARAGLDRLVAWEQSEDEEHQAMQSSAKISVRLATGHAEEALEHGKQLLAHAIETLGASNESVRHTWPDTLQAALQLARTDDARWLLALLAERPPGHIPPYLDAQLARGRALLAAAEGRHDSVEAEFNAAIFGFRSLGYPYWLAVAQTDLVAWLIGQDQAGDAAALLDTATTALESLGAAPRLARAQELRRTRTGAAAS
jgi:class 3 adenylate cyclase/tetratricopeptide (TPR) repeat protein